MSTRAVIARTTGAPSSVTGQPHWEGRYHHFDGYPSGLGKRLYELAQQHDLSWLLALLIDEHPAGWSNILTCDITATAGYREVNVQSSDDEPAWRDIEAHMRWERMQGPLCYCHGTRHEGAYPLITDASRDAWGTEWAYAIDANVRTLAVYARRYDNTYPDLPYHPARAYWAHVATVALEGPEPDWLAMEGRTPPDASLSDA